MTSTEVHTTEAENHIELVLIGFLPSLAGGEGRPALAAPSGAARIYSTEVFVYEQQSSLYHAWDPMQKGGRELHL